MSLRIVPLPIEQARVPVFRVACSRAPKLLRRSKTPGFLEALYAGELYRFWNTTWHHYAPTEPHAETSSIRNALGIEEQNGLRMLARKVVHIDMDAYYASVELRDDPLFRGKPVIVAWRGNRSVVCAASYEARKSGVRSAMPAVRAERLCPNAIFLPPDFPRCRAVSRQMREIFKHHTDLSEPLSLDEAYLDVSENKTGLSTATQVARTIREQIRSELSLTASAGVAPNKFSREDRLRLEKTGWAVRHSGGGRTQSVKNSKALQVSHLRPEGAPRPALSWSTWYTPSHFVRHLNRGQGPATIPMLVFS